MKSYTVKEMNADTMTVDFVAEELTFSETFDIKTLPMHDQDVLDLYFSRFIDAFVSGLAAVKAAETPKPIAGIVNVTRELTI